MFSIALRLFHQAVKFLHKILQNLNSFFIHLSSRSMSV
jgi:hypothetical protein